MPDFEIQSGGGYKHASGSTGKYSYDAAQSLITLQGSNLDKQAGLMQAGEKPARIRLYNERRNRTVIDCDSGK
ncbi:MAG TPA: hypothetical protein VMZ52_05570 [Bryobacteraceae bacterium]|nr:hypothetical protein [Bryobacteraceae bacterium]